MTPLKVLFVSSELNPLAKVGGLGDVAGSLPPALADLDIDIRCVLPKYDVIQTDAYPATRIAERIPVARCGTTEYIDLYETTIPESSVPVYLLDNSTYLGNGGVYLEKTAFVGSFKEIERFLFLSLASLEIFDSLNWWPDVIHCQDWHTALIPFFLQQKKEQDARYKQIKTLLTIHNLANQGLWSEQEISEFLCVDPQHMPYRTEQNINLIGCGIALTDAVNTVSKTYATEITTPEYGEGLEDLMRSKEKIYGIINGVDQKDFNPQTNTEIAQRYSSADSIQDIRKAKSINKRALQKSMGLPENSDIPVCGLVSRLTNQKGVECIFPLLDQLVEQNVQCIFLGVGDPRLEAQLEEVAKKYSQNIAVRIEFNAPLAKQIYAGSDIFLMPSKFEPCGLGQMIAMRYGTIPIVRATGGLKDTVHADVGFSFEEFSSDALRAAIQHALLAWSNETTWNELIQNTMHFDSTWPRAAKEYADIYVSLKK